MEELVILLGLNGRKLTEGWYEILPLLRLIDNTITTASRWSMIRRNFFHNYRLKMDITEDKIFYCELLDEDDEEYIDFETHYYIVDSWEKMMGGRNVGSLFK